MQFVRSWKFSLAIGAIIALVASMGVAYGVMTHSEPGLSTSSISWPEDRIPLDVCPHSYVGSSTDAVLVVAEAITTTNERLGFEVFRPSLDPESCDVTVEIGVPAEVGWMDPGGDARVVNGPVCEVRTSNTGTTEILGLVLQHELGHCLGLDHDEWDGSIMRREQSSTPSGQLPPRITDLDRALLVDLYGPQAG